MSSITPNVDQFAELAAAPDDAPVVMLNLLQFKAQADGSGDSGASGATGADEYSRYGDRARRMVEERGGRVLWMGAVDQVLIGDMTEGWDAIALVEYPSRAAFIEMVTTPEYTKAHEHREAGLARTLLLACHASPAMSAD